MATTTKTKRGKLKIGDQWNAITIIARSQTHPLKAVCELVENAIDARAQDIHIVRRRKKGKPYLEIWDDGNGLVLDDDGSPDFAHIATHVCDSMKRHLTSDERGGIHGEFGIGLLSFWSLGEELRMASTSRDGTLREMILNRGKRSYAVQSVRGELSTGGTRIIVGPLLDATRTIVTGEKLQRYLAVELRDRIRGAGVRVRISDRISRKELVVVPREFQGDRLDVPPQISTSTGDVRVELYVRSSSKSDETGVAVCKDGTRVLRNITELHYFQQAPWNDSRLEGVLDSPTLNLAPGTRGGIVPDENLQSFVSGVESLSEQVQSAIEKWDQAETDKASRQILKQVHRAFVSALQDLPSNEYLFFDIPQTQNRFPTKNGSSTPREETGLAVQRKTVSNPEEIERDEPLLLPLEPGPLETVAIRPATARRQIGDACRLKATAHDASGTAIPDGVEFTWKLLNETGVIQQADDNECTITSKEVGQVSVSVSATQEDKQATAEVAVKFFENLSSEPKDGTTGLPSYRLEVDRGALWRSRYDVTANEIVINSAHRDFLACKQTAAKHRRYIGKLYAKEVVLINFAHETPRDVMDRLIEVLVRTEDAL